MQGKVIQPVASWDETEVREEWNAFLVLHAGEGPCVNPQRMLAIGTMTAHEAAELYGSEYLISEQDLEFRFTLLGLCRGDAGDRRVLLR